MAKINQLLHWFVFFSVGACLFDYFRPPSRSVRTCRVFTGRASVENGQITLSRPVHITAAFGGR